MGIECFQFTYGTDNYGVLIHDTEKNYTAAIDAGDSNCYLNALTETGWILNEIWVTHHHADHVSGLSSLKSKTNAKVIGPPNISGVDKTLSDGDTLMFCGNEVHIIKTPGHTLDMINYYIPAENLIFTGDTLFVMGCGRLFEGSPEQMYESICKIMALPPETVLYCSHEYTLANAQFALTIDPNNNELTKRVEEITKIIVLGNHTVPTTIAHEAKTNPFCRTDNEAIRQVLEMTEASNVDVFARIRELKDNF